MPVFLSLICRIATDGPAPLTMTNASLTMKDCSAHDVSPMYFNRRPFTDVIFILILYANCISLDIELCDSWEVAENPRNRVGLITISFDNEN